jgi:hypothetical protein
MLPITLDAVGRPHMFMPNTGLDLETARRIAISGSDTATIVVHEAKVSTSGKYVVILISEGDGNGGAIVLTRSIPEEVPLPSMKEFRNLVDRLDLGRAAGSTADRRKNFPVFNEMWERMMAGED